MDDRYLKFIDFHTWAANNALSYTISFWEASGEWEVEVMSASPGERLYMKRCPGFDYFQKKWEEQVATAVREGKIKCSNCLGYGYNLAGDCQECGKLGDPNRKV